MYVLVSGGALTHVSGTLDEVEAELGNDVIFSPQYLANSACNPSGEDGTSALPGRGWRMNGVDG